jgi:ubiquinone/menaquinone biosynthesis C-methylase UbiE/DNA-binding transcriptional ArsR family regulator
MARPVPPVTATAPERVVAALRAAGEPTRLRILALLADGELNVSDLTAILAQSQPRISRHLRLLTDAGLVDRHREGSWAFFRLAEAGAGASLGRAVVRHLAPDDAALAADRARLAEQRQARASSAAAYFGAHAAEWDQIRALHVEERAVERAIRRVLGPAPVGTLVDIGTGTGRIIELLGGRAERAVGIDASPAMLAVARANLAGAGLAHVQLRQGDVYALPLRDGSADLVVLHQVLHFLDEPGRAIAEAARVLHPQGRLLVVDFAPHELEFLRDAHAHRRLGFTAEAVEQWIRQAQLEPLRHQTLPPPGGAPDKLTVSLWLARDPRLVVDPPLPARPAESRLA